MPQVMQQPAGPLIHPLRSDRPRDVSTRTLLALLLALPTPLQTNPLMQLLFLPGYRTD